MSDQQESPCIINLSWGEVQVEGYERPFRDVKLYPGGAREWDWNETGTHHRPGVQPADVEELAAHGAETVILSKGIQERLQVKPETIEWLEARGVSVEVLQTEKAVEEYNRRREETAVAGLFHSTC